MPRTMQVIRNVVTLLFLLSLLPFLIDLWMKANAVAAGEMPRIADGLAGMLQRLADETPMMVATLWLGGMSSSIWIDEAISARARSFRRSLPFQNKFPNAMLRDVARHVGGHLARLGGAAAPAITPAAITHAIVDSAVHGTLAMWGRQGDRPLELLTPPVIAHGVLDLASDMLRVTEPRGRTVRYADIRFDWADINRIWPPATPPLRPARIARAEPEADAEAAMDA